MMLTFRSYLTDRNNLLSTGKLAGELARKTEDPEAFILDFVEARYPSLYSPLLESIYLEVDDNPRPPTGSGSKAGSSGGGSEDGPGARPAHEVKHDSFLGWLNNLFSGGGAAKNFDKATKALTKVDSVVRTIKIDKHLQNKGGPVAGYDDFAEKLSGVLAKMKKLAQHSQILHVADAIKRDPNYVQELDKELEGVRAEDEAEGGGEGGGEAGGDIEKVTPSLNSRYELDKRRSLGEYVYNSLLRFASKDGDFKEKITRPSGWSGGQLPAGSKYIPGYLTALSLAAMKLFEKEHGHGDDDEQFANWWNKNKGGILKKAAAYVIVPAAAPPTPAPGSTQTPAPGSTQTPAPGSTQTPPAPAADVSEHGGGSSPVDGYHLSHTVHKGNVFAEALVLAGVQHTKKRKTR